MFCKICQLSASTYKGINGIKFDSQVLDAHIWFYSYKDVGHVLTKAKFSKKFSHYDHLLKVAIPDLVELLRDTVSGKELVITCVPAIERSLKKRGFDHSKLIAMSLSSAVKINFVNLLIPIHENHQHCLKRAERYFNPQYLCRKEEIGGTVLLIDDISTTRSTLFAAAKELKKCGADAVVGITIAQQGVLSKNSQSISRTSRN